MEKTLKHEFVPFEVGEVHEERPLSPMPPAYREASPVPVPMAMAGQREVSPVPAYVPKQGKMTVDDVERELTMLAERMEFLEKTLQELKKENAKDL